MEASEIFKDNVFIAKAIKLYDELQYGYPVKMETEIVTKEEYHKVLGSVYHKKTTRKERDKFENICEQYKYYAHNLAVNPLYFSNLWQFCQFIRWAEKVVFYKNIINRTLYVDSSIDDVDCRTIVYTDRKCNNLIEGDYQIKIKMEKVMNPAYSPNTLSDILSIDKNNTPKYFKSMKIVVERFYGKHMTNHFTIIDDNWNELDDSSDTMLIETITNQFSIAIEKIIKEIYDLIYNYYKKDDI